MIRKPHSLAHKVLIAFALTLIPILVIFLLNYQTNKRNLENLIVEDMRVTAHNSEIEILFFLEMVRNRIEDFSTDGFIRDELEKIVAGKADGEALSEYIRVNKLPILEHIYRISVMNTGGKVVASTMSSVVGKDVSGEEFFRRGVSGVSVVERYTEYMDGYELAVSAPVYSRNDGQITGVISGFMPLSRFDRVFTGEFSEELGASVWEEFKGKKTFETLLINSKKKIVATSLPMAVIPDSVETLPVSSCFEANENVHGHWVDYRGVDIVGATICMPSMGWVLVAKIDKEEVFAPVTRINIYAILTALSTVILIAALVFYFIRIIIVQLRKLAAASKEITAGNYDVKIPVESGDELGVLSEAFNEMAKGIKQRDFVLRDREERLSAILDNTTSVIYLKDVEGRYILINRVYERLFNVRQEELYGKTDYDLFPKDASDQFRRNDLKALESGRAIEIEEQVPQEDGIHTYISIKCPIYGPDGKAYALCGISTDITDRKRAEEALRRSEESLTNAQRIARLGNWDLDVIKNELVWSDEVYRIFGVAPKEFGASYDAFLSYVHPDDRVYVASEVRKAFYEKKPYSIDHRIIVEGEVRIVHAQGEVAFDENGAPVRMSGTVQDITERKRIEDELRKLNEELEKRVADRTVEIEAANRELEAFSYSVAHDLRAPLRIIGGFTRVLLEKHFEGFDREGREYLARIGAASTRMEELIDDLLALSQVIRAEMRREEVDLSEMARAIAFDLKKSEPGRNVEFIIEDGLTARGDERLLRLMLENLFGNAWKFTGRKPEAKIEFRSGGKIDGRTAYFVRDNGAGFNMKYAERLFSAFQRLHSADEFPGTGIGLATVYRIVKRHGGKVWAEGETGRGATFYFTL